MSTIFSPYSESEALRSDRSAGDRKRHREKLRRSIRENIADVIAEESIIGRDRDRVIKVPIRGVKEYRFVFGDNAGGVGTGDGSTEPGQVVGSARGKGDQRPGPGRQRPRPRLLRDRDHARRADRHHVRGSRAARPRAQDPQAGDGRARRQAAGLPQGRHPGPSRPPPHRSRPSCAARSPPACRSATPRPRSRADRRGRAAASSRSARRT